MIPTELVDGMIGNYTPSRGASRAAKITVARLDTKGRITVALYTSHIDRMLFGDGALLKTVTMKPERFRPCDSRVQPHEVMVRVVEKRIARETGVVK